MKFIAYFLSALTIGLFSVTSGAVENRKNDQQTVNTSGTASEVPGPTTKTSATTHTGNKADTMTKWVDDGLGAKNKKMKGSVSCNKKKMKKYLKANKTWCAKSGKPYPRCGLKCDDNDIAVTVPLSTSNPDNSNADKSSAAL